VRRWRIGVAGALAAGLLAASSPAEEERGLNASHEGYPLYLRYCADCHGLRADGKGRRAQALARPPSDLTRLSARRGEPMRLDELSRIIDGRRNMQGHAAADMPIWGEQFLGEVPNPAMRERARIRLVQSLAEYVLSIQVAAEPAAEEKDPAQP
jgi:mono/diheme cytochrome c family protein